MLTSKFFNPNKRLLLAIVVDSIPIQCGYMSYIDGIHSFLSDIVVTGWSAVATSCSTIVLMRGLGFVIIWGRARNMMAPNIEVVIYRKVGPRGTLQKTRVFSTKQTWAIMVRMTLYRNTIKMSSCAWNQQDKNQKLMRIILTYPRFINVRHPRFINVNYHQ